MELLLIIKWQVAAVNGKAGEQLGHGIGEFGVSGWVICTGLGTIVAHQSGHL